MADAEIFRLTGGGGGGEGGRSFLSKHLDDKKGVREGGYAKTETGPLYALFNITT